MDIEGVRNYCMSKAYVTEDMPFGDDYVAFRVGGKIFCGIPLEKQGVVQLKCDEKRFDETLAAYSYVEQAWHWHKRHWIQFNLNENVIPDGEVKMLIDRAYEEVYCKLPKKVKAALTI